MKYKFFALLCIGFILLFSIQSVELGWSKTDVLFSETTCGVAIVAFLMLIWRKQQMSLSAIDIVVALWFAYVMIRSYVDSSFPNANFCLRAMQMFLLYVCVRLLLSSEDVSERMIVFAILLCGIYEVFLGAVQLINGGSRHHLFLISGSFLNPGPYSVFLSMGLVMSCQFRKSNHSSNTILTSLFNWLPLFFFILLPATWSRAAILAAAICLGIIYWNLWRRYRWYVFGGLGFVFIGLYFLKQGSADGRSIIYMISLLSICHAPVFGSGIGSFCHQYAEEMANFSSLHPTFNFQSADVIDGAFNSILQIGVEQGLVGVSFAVVLVLLLYARLMKCGKTLGIGLLCMSIISMFSYPFDLLPYQIIFVLISGYAATVKKGYLIFAKRGQLFQRHLVSLMSISCVVFLFVFSHQQIKGREKAESDYKIMAGLTETAFLDSYYRLLPLLASNKYFLFDFSKMLIADGRYSDSNAVLRKGTLISNDPMFYIIQGNNYREMGFWEEAEYAYQKAFYIMPNRLYPLYQLMLLYEKEGKTNQMIDMTQRIMAFNEKVVSSATMEMKKNAKEKWKRYCQNR